MALYARQDERERGVCVETEPFGRDGVEGKRVDFPVGEMAERGECVCGVSLWGGRRAEEGGEGCVEEAEDGGRAAVEGWAGQGERGKRGRAQARAGGVRSCGCLCRRRRARDAIGEGGPRWDMACMPRQGGRVHQKRGIAACRGLMEDSQGLDPLLSHSLGNPTASDRALRNHSHSGQPIS